MSQTRAFFGAFALSAVNAGKLALQFLVLPILARVLGPAAFGLVALAMPFILLANTLCDAGLGTALIRESNPPAQLESTVFWLSLVAGAALAAFICLIDWPAARLLGQPSLAPILMALSPILVLSGGLSVANARISRERRFTVFAVGDMISSPLSAVCGIAAALSGLGAWSLVIQQLVLWLVKVAWILPASRFRPRLYCDLRLAAPLLSFGLHGVGANIADFVGKNTATVVVGAGLGVAALGHYAMAYQLVRIPELVISGPLYLSILTAIALVARDRAVAARQSMTSIRLFVTALAPMFGGLTIVAPPLVGLILGDRWVEAGPVLAALAPAGFFLCLYSVVGAILMGMGRSDRQFRLTLLVGAGLIAGAFVGARSGAVGTAIGLSIGSAAALPFYVALLADTLGLPARAIIRETAPALLAALAMTGLVWLVAGQIAAVPLLPRLIIEVVVGATAFLAFIGLLYGRRVLEDVRGLLPTRLRA